MTAAAFPASTLDFPARTPRRIAFALVVSAIFHLLFATLLAPEAQRRVAQAGTAAPIIVRLDLDTDSGVSAGSPRLDVEPPIARSRARQHTPRAPVPGNGQRTMPVGQETQPAQDVAATATLSLPQVPDPTYYSARELDVYPRPAAPLKLGYPAGAPRDGVAGRVRLSLLIDEHGVVNHIAIVEAEPPGYFEEEARAVLAATRFVPARKDGLPVKSRVLISLSFAPAREETVTSDR